ncbi:hypothetical protein D3C75_926100 [compost metagenome]
MIAVIGNQKSKPFCMSLYTPAHQIHALRYPIAGIAGQYHSSILLKCEQQLLERFERLAVLYREMAHQFFISKRLISGLPHEIQ